MSTTTFTPKFKEGDLAYGILGAEIRKVNIQRVLVAPGATSPIHVTNTDDEGRVWDDTRLFKEPVDAAKNLLDKYFTKYPDEAPKTWQHGTSEEIDARFEAAEEAEAKKAAPAATEPAATEPAATEPAATEPAATEPAATEPAATEPAAPEPAAPEPAAPAAPAAPAKEEVNPEG